MKNLLKFISIGLVLMVVVFSQMTDKSAVIEAADVAENDIEFMDTTDTVVKSYKASSSDTTVYLYVRDKDLNTTFSGETTWVAGTSGKTRELLSTSTFTLDKAGTDTLLASGKGKTAGNPTGGTGAATANRKNGTYADVECTASGNGIGAKFDITVKTTGGATGAVDAGGVVIDGTHKGSNYAVDEDITCTNGSLHADVSGAGTGTLTFKMTAVDASGTPVAAAFTKAEDSDQGGTSNMYYGTQSPLKLNTLTVKKGNLSLGTNNVNETDGTFKLDANVSAGDAAATGVKATYSFSGHDTYSALKAGSKRVHVTSSSDATGEWILIEEVGDEGVTNANFTGGILAIDGVGGADSARVAGTYTVDPADYTTGSSGRDAVFEVVVDSAGAATVSIKDGHSGIGFANDEQVSITNTHIGGGGATLTFNVNGVEASAAASVDSAVFLGMVKINTDASAGAADNGQVWVQDGDTLTASFYKAKSTDGENTTGDLIKSTTAVIDATAPTISNIEPADGSLTSDKTPKISFTLEDNGSGFSDNVANLGSHVSVEINGCAVPWTALNVASNNKNTINISYSAPVDWTTDAKDSSNDPNTNCTTGNARTQGGFNVAGTAGPTALTSSTVHGTKFNWYIKATDVAGNEKVVGIDDHNGSTADNLETLDLRIDTQVPAATAVTGAKAWSASDKKDVTDNSSVKISFDESLDPSTVDASDFTVSGVGVTSSTIDTVTMGGKDGTTGMAVYLDLAADLGPNAKPKVKLVGEVSDLAGNILKPATTETTGKTLGTSTDGVKPSLGSGAVSAALIKKDGKSDVTFTSNENLTKTGVAYGTARGTYLSVSGGGEDSGTSGVVTLDGTGDAGNVAVTLSNPTSAKGTLKHGTAEDGVPMTKTGIYGLASVGRDAADNVGVGGITKVIEDVSASFSDSTLAVAADATAEDSLRTDNVTADDTIWIKLKNWPLADHDGDGSLMDSITAITVAGDPVTDLTYVDANAKSTGSAGGGIRRDSTFANHADTTFTIKSGAGLVDIDGGGTVADGTFNAVAGAGNGACDGAKFDIAFDGTQTEDETVTLTLADITVDTADTTGCIIGEEITILHKDMDAKFETGSLIITVTALGDGTVDATDDMSMYVSKVDWSEKERIQLTATDASDIHIAENATVKVTYYYVNSEQVVELDLDAPSVVIAPANLASTTDKTPSLSFAWDDDEYAGDGNTTVTMTKAELKDPDGAVTDISAELTTTDNKTYYYVPTADLANGEYKVTVSGKDVAGNELKDSSSKFTVKDRTKTTIAMVPGWNLISIPSAPSDGAIDTVITNTQVETVLTYDPATPGGWLTAVRDGDALVGTLTTIDESHAYWVFQRNGDDIKVDLPGFKGGASATPPAIPVVEGWNLIPVVSLTVGESTVATSVDKDGYLWGIDWVKAKGWNATAEKWTEVTPDTSATPNLTGGTDLSVGSGYWLYANSAGVIVP